MCIYLPAHYSGIRWGVTWRPLLIILSISALCCVVCSPIAFPNSAYACVRNVVWFKAVCIGWIVSECGTLPTPGHVAWLYWPSSAARSFDASTSTHSLSPSLDCFCLTFQKCFQTWPRRGVRGWHLIRSRAAMIFCLTTSLVALILLFPIAQISQISARVIEIHRLKAFSVDCQEQC